MQERLWANSKAAITKQIADIMQQSVAVAKKVLEQLVAEGYVASKKVKITSGFVYQVTETEKGSRFGIATANPQLKAIINTFDIFFMVFL